MEYFFIPLKTKEQKQESLFAQYLQMQWVEVFWNKVAYSL